MDNQNDTFYIFQVQNRCCGIISREEQSRNKLSNEACGRSTNGQFNKILRWISTILYYSLRLSGLSRLKIALF
jgi:hypothetical protein